MNICKLVANLKGRVYDEVFQDTFVTMPGIWDLIALEDYEEAKAYLLDEKTDAQLIARIDAYHYQVQAKLPELFRAAMETGTKINVVSHYNLQGVPLTPSYREQNDNVIDTKYTSGYATCAFLDETLPADYQQKHTSCQDATHNHLSGDRVIDASTDFTTGGDSYENELHSAHVDKPAFENAPIKTWEGEPMYIGLGFKNTLQTKRNRGMYHTMLPGAVSQVRFYTSKLSENEVTAVRNNPTSAGASKNSLKIWLDFEDSNIETSGSHTTEWVEATAAPTALSYNAAFAGKASITATVQTSDDGKTVKEEKSAALTSGTGKIDLTGMADAKYVRVKTAFVSDLNSTESSVPVLNEYALTAGKTKIWNTLTDWEKGTFEGAAGHQPGHVYRNYAKDFANYGTIGDVEDSSKAGFTDVANHWAKDAINYVTDKGLMNGTGSNTFSPNASTTRGMLMTVLARYAGEDTAGGATWYEKGMNWAKAKGVSDGTNPTVKITREQLVTMLYRYAGSPAANGSLDRFSDAASVNSYAANAMQWADRKSTRLNSSHTDISRMPSSA